MLPYHPYGMAVALHCGVRAVRHAFLAKVILMDWLPSGRLQ
jgi:hypothetical protein